MKNDLTLAIQLLTIKRYHHPRLIRVGRRWAFSINDAMRMADTGDSIHVEPGTYIECIKFRKDNITVKAEGRDITFLKHPFVDFNSKTGCKLESFTLGIDKNKQGI